MDNSTAVALGIEEGPYFALNDSVRSLNATTAGLPLAGTRIDLENRRFYVYWVGPVPPALQVLGAKAAASGIALVISPAISSERQTSAAAAQMDTWAESTRTKVIIKLSSDGSGLVVQYPGLTRVAANLVAPDAAQSAVLNEMHTVEARTGVRIVAGDVVEGAGAPLDRLADVSPFWGGALTTFDNDLCTAGFSMYATNGARFMLTAAHCSQDLDGKSVRVGGESAPIAGTTDFIHEMYDTSPSYEMGVIRLAAPNTNSGRIYTQRFTSVPIAGFSANGIPPGGQYCVSGAFGIPNCNVRSGDQLLDCGTFSKCVYVIYVKSTAGAIMCKGDSGGPIYFHNSTGYIAAGAVSGGYTGDGPCYPDGAVSVVVSAMRRVPGLLLVTG